MGEFSNKKTAKQIEKINKKKNERRVNYVFIALIVIFILIFLIFFKKPNWTDFLGEIKNTFTIGMVVILGIIMFSILFAKIFIKEKKTLNNLLKILLFCNIVLLVVFFYTESVLDKTYNNEETFGTFYDTKLEEKTDEEYVDLWQTFLNQKVKTKSAREVFIEENMTQFIYFKIRVYLIFILYVITIMANSYLILKLEKAIKARKILDKDDKIIFKNNV